MEEMDVTIVIPTLGRVREATELASVLDGLDPGPKQVIFVFQRSDELKKWEDTRVSTLATGLLCGSQGSSVARNHGAKQAHTKYLVFLDDDCVPAEKSWMAQLIAPLAWPKVVLATGQVRGWDDYANPFKLVKKAFMLSKWLLIPYGNPESDRSGWCMTVAGGNFAVETQKFLRFGGFSERFGSPSIFEETELSLRFSRAGKGKIWYSADAAVAHRQAKHGGMRDQDAEPLEGFLLGQKRLLFSLLFGEGFSMAVRFALYRLLRRVLRVLR